MAHSPRFSKKMSEPRGQVLIELLLSIVLLLTFLLSSLLVSQDAYQVSRQHLLSQQGERP